MHEITKTTQAASGNMPISETLGVLKVVLAILLPFLVSRVYSHEPALPLGYDDDANNTLLSCDEVIEDDELQATMRAGVPEFWPGALVPYATLNFQEKDHQVLNSALEEFHRRTCIRFVARTNEQAFVNISIVVNEKRWCGSALACHSGRARRVYISDTCVVKSIIIHELAHSLCLFHEQTRPDREDYLDYSNCKDPSKINKIVSRTSTQGHLYDYYSHMHYVCGGCGGVPKMKRVTRCGRQGPDLGVLDSDKLNAFYGCGGCHRHRWFRTDTLTAEEQSALVNFASQEGDTEPVYLCRGFVDGTLASGTYLLSEKVCLASTEYLTVVTVPGPVQLFALPGGPNSIANFSSQPQAGYQLYPPSGHVQQAPYIRSGRDYKNLVYHSTVTWWTGKDGKKRTWLGYVPAEAVDWGLFPTTESESSLLFRFDPDKGQIFGILGCE